MTVGDIQLAKHLGVHVATTVNTNDKQFVQELGIILRIILRITW